MGPIISILQDLTTSWGGWGCAPTGHLKWGGKVIGLKQQMSSLMFRRLCVTVSTRRLLPPQVRFILLHHKNKCNLPAQELDLQSHQNPQLFLHRRPGTQDLLLTADFRYRLNLCWVVSSCPRLVSGILLLMNYISYRDIFFFLLASFLNSHGARNSP